MNSKVRIKIIVFLVSFFCADSFVYGDPCDPVIGCVVVNTTTNTISYLEDCEYSACDGDQINVDIYFIEGNSEEYTYSWDNGSSSSISPTNPGTYGLTFQHVDEDCKIIRQFEYNEEIVPFPDVECYRLDTSDGAVTFHDNCTIRVCEGEEVRLGVNFTNGNPDDFSFSWNNGSTSLLTSPSAPGVYTLTMTHLDSGCSADYHINYEVAYADGIFDEQCWPECPHSFYLTPWTEQYSITSYADYEAGLYDQCNFNILHYFRFGFWFDDINWLDACELGGNFTGQIMLEDGTVLFEIDQSLDDAAGGQNPWAEHARYGFKFDVSGFTYNSEAPIHDNSWADNYIGYAPDDLLVDPELLYFDPGICEQMSTTVSVLLDLSEVTTGCTCSMPDEVYSSATYTFSCHKPDTYDCYPLVIVEGKTGFENFDSESSTNIEIRYGSNGEVFCAVEGIIEKLQYKIIDTGGSYISNGIMTEALSSIDTAELPKGIYVIQTAIGNEKFVVN